MAGVDMCLLLVVFVMRSVHGQTVLTGTDGYITYHVGGGEITSHFLLQFAEFLSGRPHDIMNNGYSSHELLVECKCNTYSMYSFPWL